MTDESKEVAQEAVSPLSMSDDAVMEMPEYVPPAEETPSEETIEEEENNSTESNTEIVDEEGEESEIEETTEDDEGSVEEQSDDTEAEDSDAGDVSDGDNVPDASDTDDDSSTVNYEDEHKKLLAPFKANNREMQVDSVEEARKLMQMGANYTKKMTELKPNLRIMKMLDNHNLLDESKLSYLIDLDKKNPEAISKLIKESGLDPLDMDTEKETSYQPSTYTVDDKEVQLDTILGDIRGTSSYNQTVDIISNKWDESSKRIIVENPDLITIINDHVTSGVYEQINSVIERKRMLGELNGISDLDAYKQVGDAIQARDGFNKKPDSVPEVVKPKAKKAVDPKVSKRKKAASTTKTTPTSKKADFNPLSMSDAEFEEMSSKFA